MRVPEQLIKQEEIPDEELNINMAHIAEAQRDHVNAKKVEQLRKQDAQFSIKPNSLGDLGEFNENMIFRVYIRDRYKKNGVSDLNAHALAIETDLHSTEIHYQSVRVKQTTMPYIQVLCDHEEERENVKHLLLKSRHVLCFENGTNRFFSKYA